MNFPGGGEGYSATGKVTKYEDLPKYEFSQGGGYSATEKSQSTKIYLNMNFPGGGGGILQLEKSQSTKISDNFHWGGVF